MNENPVQQPSEPASFGQKLKDQIPSVFLTALLVIGAGVVMYKQALNRQDAALAPLREQE